METPPAQDVTELLSSVAADEPGAAERLFPLVYEELRRLAGARMARERSDHTLQPTALVNEAYIRLIGEGDPGFSERRHFFAAASEAMRRILIEHARAHGRVKRGGARRRQELRDHDAAVTHEPGNLLALDEALRELEREDPRMAEIVKLRFFVGLSAAQAAEALGVTRRTVLREWATARAWLRVAMGGAGTAAGDGGSDDGE
ncbi:MAG: ECF-type sigma factor [Planctomycetota bacterium]|jgi:RNA polymerase sigma factor (TIGR02999 family)